MRNRKDFGMFVNEVDYKQAMKRLNTLFWDNDTHGEFVLFPETALGTPLSFPDHGWQICRRIFPFTAAIGVRLEKMPRDLLRKLRSEEMHEEFW
jgi:hypothetical protein